jgi:hypothetical protein
VCAPPLCESSRQWETCAREAWEDLIAAYVHRNAMWQRRIANEPHNMPRRRPGRFFDEVVKVVTHQHLSTTVVDEGLHQRARSACHGTYLLVTVAADQHHTQQRLEHLFTRAVPLRSNLFAAVPMSSAELQTSPRLDATTHDERQQADVPDLSTRYVVLNVPRPSHSFHLRCRTCDHWLR